MTEPAPEKWAQMAYVHRFLMDDPPRLAAFDKQQAEAVEYGAAEDGYVLTGPAARVGDPEPLWYVDFPDAEPGEPSGTYITEPQRALYGVPDDTPPTALMLRYEAPIKRRNP